LNEIQEKYKDDPARQAEETMKAFKKEWKWPLKWCLWALIQLPIFLALYWVVRKMTEWSIPEDWLYSFFYSFWDQFASVQAIDNGSIKDTFLWIKLFEAKNVWLTIIVVILTILQMKLTNLVKPKSATMPQKWPNGQPMPDMSKMMWMMTWFMAFMMWSVVYNIQSAIWLYLVTTTLFSVIQYTIQYRKFIYAEWLSFRNKPQIISKK
jgi:YidC/Oxa1 family membrane protein insertase